MIAKSLEKKENNNVSFQVETSAEEFEAAVNSAYLKNKSSIYIPGFRKGKAPRQIVEGMYGHEVFYQDALDELAPKAFEFGAKENELRMVGAPAIEDVKVTDERTAEFTFAVALYPEVTLGEYKGLAAPKAEVSVSEEDVDKAVDKAREQNARILTVDDRPAQNGDHVNIDFDGYLDGERFDGGKAEGYDLVLGSGSFVPGFEEQVVGMQTGEEKDIDITFPEDYAEELAGKPVVFKVKLNSISVSELPEADDEFAKDVSEYDTLAEYRDSVRAELVKNAEERRDNEFRSEIIRKACENMTVDIPEVMISDKVEEIIRNYAANFGIPAGDMPFDKLCETMGLTNETLNGGIRASAKAQVETELLLEAVIKAEELSATDEDCDEYVNKVAENIGASADEVKKYFGKEFITKELLKERATKIITDSAVAEEPAEETSEKAEEKPAEEEKAE